MTTDAITVVAKFTFDEAVVGEQRTRLWKVKPSNLRNRSHDCACTVMEITAEQYRQKAQECREHANLATNDVDRAAWLQLAAEWAELAQSLEWRRRRAG
jgi:hypothetical protein